MIKEKNIQSYFSFRALFMGIGISKILILSKNYFFITSILGTLLGLIIIYIFNKPQNKFINSISNYLIYLMCFIDILNLISTMYLNETSKWLISIPLILLLIYSLSKTSNSLLKTFEILLIMNIILYSLFTIPLLKYINFSNYSYTKFNINKILKSTFDYAMISSVPFIIINNNLKTKDVYKTYIISNITMMIILFIVISILGINLIDNFRYPEYIILKKVSLTYAFENIENLFSFIWLIDIYVLMTSCLDKIRNNYNNKILINSLIILSMFIVVTFSKYIQLLMFFYNYSSLIFFIILLFSLLHEKNSS